MLVEITNRHKKSFEEVEMWYNSETRFGITITTGWRSGTARLTIESLDDLLADPETDSTDDADYEIDCAGFGENYEFVDSWDACWEDFNVWKVGATDEEIEEETERLEAIWDEDRWCGIEEEGFNQTDHEAYFYGPINVEVIEE